MPFYPFLGEGFPTKIDYRKRPSFSGREARTQVQARTPVAGRTCDTPTSWRAWALSAPRIASTSNWSMLRSCNAGPPVAVVGGARAGAFLVGALRSRVHATKIYGAQQANSPRAMNTTCLGAQLQVGMAMSYLWTSFSAGLGQPFPFSAPNILTSLAIFTGLMTPTP